MGDQATEKDVLTNEERSALDERIAGDWWGYYIHFEPTGVPEVDRVLSAVGLAGKMYHHTDMWNDDDADYGPVRKGESPVGFIQRAANDAAQALRQGVHRCTNCGAPTDGRRTRFGAPLCGTCFAGRAASELRTPPGATS